MSVFRRETSKGFTDSYHYRFYHKGETYSGVCTDCSNKQEALNYEKRQREDVEKSQANNDPAVIPQVIKSLHRKATGRELLNITLAEAFEKSLEKPKPRKATGDFLGAKRSYWKDWVLFMADKYREVTFLSEVNSTHAEAYISYVRDNGRFNKQVESKDGKEYERKGNLSPRSANVILVTLREVFKLLQKDAGIFENPFEDIDPLANESETREPFTEEELKKIFKNADEFIYPLFAIGISTGLREGDICTLMWNEIDFKDNYIKHKMMKTDKYVEIPMIFSLRKYMMELREKANKQQKYVLPAHAEMYRDNASGISYRIKEFLDGLDIETTKKIKGRTRRVSVKDLHALRHSFAYIAGVANIPLVIVQSILGHMTPEMTKHYQRHADHKAKATALKAMPDFITINSGDGKDVKLLPDAPENRIKEATKLIRGAAKKDISESFSVKLITLLEG